MGPSAFGLHVDSEPSWCRTGRAAPIEPIEWAAGNRRRVTSDVDGDDGAFPCCIRPRSGFRADGPGDAAAHLRRGLLLALAVEHVAVVDGALQAQQPHFTESAFAL